MFPTNSERLIGTYDAFSAFVYGYPSSCPCAQCTPNKSVTTLRHTCSHGPVYTGYACRHLPSAVPWISEDRLLCIINMTLYPLLHRKAELDRTWTLPHASMPPSHSTGQPVPSALCSGSCCLCGSAATVLSAHRAAPVTYNVYC